jgi:adenosylmethionine-8-amino-7-oxononanoate aminotransferase
VIEQEGAADPSDEPEVSTMKGFLMNAVGRPNHLDERAAALVDWDRQHVGHHAISFGNNCGFLVDRTDGVSWFTSDGKEILDSSSQLMCLSLGYREQYKREVAEAVAAQLMKVPYSTNFWGFTNEATVAAAQALAEIAPPALQMFVFTPGGGESVEIALELSRAYWKHKGTGKYKIISLQNSYHGMYIGSGSATRLGNGRIMSLYGPPAAGFRAAPDYDCYRCPLGMSYPDCGLQCAKMVENTIMVEGPDTVAALIVEVEHGSAGCIPSPDGYMQAVREICTRNNVLLIVDEVMTGFGRTSVDGNAFACQISGVSPDLMTMAKGITSSYIPLGAVGLSKEVADGLRGSFVSGPTYAAHPVSCAAAAKVMEIYKRDGVFQHAAEMGRYMRSALNEQLVAEIPEVDQVSGFGMLLGLEVLKDPETKERQPHEAMVALQDGALERGLFIRLSGFGSRMMFCPPLVSTKEEIDRMISILVDTFKEGSWRSR